MAAVFLFVFGLVIGSFLNVLAFRYDPDQPFFGLKRWGGRSHCLFCSQQLKWYELIPILSFIIQEGRCLVCRKKLFWQYPLVELASGLTFFLPYYFYNSANEASYFITAFWILIFLIFILIWAIDARISVIPDELNFFLGLLGVALLDMTNASRVIWLNHFWAALAGALFFGAIIYFSEGRAMGGGDLKMAVALGLIFGWPNLVYILAVAFVVGAFWGLTLMGLNKKNSKDAVPFGPFLILGSLVIFFFGDVLISAYWRLLI
ncbi:MAG: prepilin peptidase [bacterium]|nr:prepilin peptidase [bacterium]